MDFYNYSGKITLFIVLLMACGSGKEDSSEAIQYTNSKEFQDYWYQGKAELTSYHLKQARYGEIHEGDAVQIFVTEDFSSTKQVKLDRPQNSSDAVKVLKLNFTRKFNTGIYPYSIMQSVFSPVDYQKHPHALKMTTSSQEWCGHTFMQFNSKKDHYEVQIRSYFESEGDVNTTIEKTLLEDEIWTIIRLHPTDLPVGKVKLIPGSVYLRLKHRELKVMEAIIEKTINENIVYYTINYPEDQRSLTISYNQDFPHEIIGWEETYTSGWGESAEVLTTEAVLNKRIMTDYWTKNHVSDSTFRKKLGLK